MYLGMVSVLMLQELINIAFFLTYNAGIPKHSFAIRLCHIGFEIDWLCTITRPLR
jgi:hypothetical protein